tara:strand:- start:476 stop:691 length:216 start_codon:yes stop_codon:yes gene_type:complete
MESDLGTQIKNYIDWFLYECTDPQDELEYLITLIIDSGGKEKREILEVLELIARAMIKNNEQNTYNNGKRI